MKIRIENEECETVFEGEFSYLEELKKNDKPAFNISTFSKNREVDIRFFAKEDGELDGFIELLKEVRMDFRKMEGKEEIKDEHLR